MMRDPWYVKALIALLTLVASACSVAPLPLPTPTATVPAPRTPVPTVTPAPSLAPSDTPAPSLTPAPQTATATPATATVLSPSGGDLLFEFTFDSAGIWGVGETESHTIAVAGGAMNVTLKQADRFALTFAGRRASDFYAEVSAVATGCGQDDSYGLLFRFVDDDNFYYFGLGCGARFRVRHRQDGKWNELVQWTPAEAIRAGDGVENRLGVRAAGDAFQFFANGAYLGEAADSSFAEGGFGLLAQSSLAAGISAKFDNLQVRGVSNE